MVRKMKKIRANITTYVKFRSFHCTIPENSDKLSSPRPPSPWIAPGPYTLWSVQTYTDWCTPWHRLWAFFRSDNFSEKNDLIIFQGLSRCNSALKLPFPTWHMEYLHNDSNKCLYCYRAQMNLIIASLACRDTIYTSVLSNKFWPLPSC
jgi:hypothetical protein